VGPRLLNRKVGKEAKAAKKARRERVWAANCNITEWPSNGAS